MDYRTGDYPTTSSTVLLSLLLEHSNDITLEGDSLDSKPFESEDNRDRVPKTEDGLSAIDNNLDYENSDDLNNHSANKKRRTSAEHLVTSDVEPTTKRGLPPTDFTKRSPSWHYITKSDNLTTTQIPFIESTEKDASMQTTQVDVDLERTTDSTMESATTDLVREDVTMSVTSTPDQQAQSDTSKSSSVLIPAVTPIFRPTERSQVTLPATLVTDPETNSVFETISEAINETSESPSSSSTMPVNTVDSNSTGDVGTTIISTLETVALTSSTEPTVMKSESTSVEVPTTESPGTSTVKETVSTTKLAVVDRSKFDRRKEHIGPVIGRQFGRKVSGRPFNRNYFTELRETSERRTADEEKRRSQRIRARLPSSRGKHRYHTIPSASTERVEEHHTTSPTQQPISIASTVKRPEIPSTTEQPAQIATNKSDHASESPIAEEKDESDNQTEKGLEVEEEEEAEGRPLLENSEVTTLKSTRITSRTSAALSTRLRKVSTTIAPREASSLSEPRTTTFAEPKVPGKDVIIVTEEPKRSESVDQSSRAQELAVTLTDPPPSQARSTGRLPTRESLRRKISTTVAPRADTTTTTTARSRSTVRFRGRQKNKKEKSLENVTTRPRRPAIVDYDYYEDELEPVVAKSTLNGKLFLTSRGTIRCLDQGNFPHPYSCKKFITCARMVNGQVIGAEYTCPDKLSFDPIGGICNWSAGLGCKE